MLPRFRSKSVRKISRKRGSSFPFRYIRKGGRTSCCAICGANLSGGKAKSKRRPSRAFGGVLCPLCSFEVLKLAGKVKGAQMKLENIGIGKRNFVKQLVKQ